MTSLSGCPRCGAPLARTIVLNTRLSNEGRRRRRECYECGKRWNTHEVNGGRLQELLSIERRYLRQTGKPDTKGLEVPNDRAKLLIRRE